MIILLVFALTLLLAVLLSEMADRTLLSIPLLFVISGFILGPEMLAVMDIRPEDTWIRQFVELTLIAVLFVDGMHAGIHEIREVWHLPGRALLIGFPLSILLTSVVAYVLLDLSWIESLLIGAVLSPTDPVFAAAIVTRQEIPDRLRRLLNVESGLNDGLALPIVLAIIALAGPQDVHVGTWLLDLGLAVVLGAGIPWLVLSLQRLPIFDTNDLFKPLLVFTIGLLIYTVASVVGANHFIAAFVGGIAIVTFDKELREAFFRLGESVAEVLKLAAVLIFGALLSQRLFTNTEWEIVVFALLVLVLARPASMALALWRTTLSKREKLTAIWFRPSGFASIVYGLLLFSSGLNRADDLFRIIAVTVLAFIVAHTTTDVVVARWLIDENDGQSEENVQVAENVDGRSSVDGDAEGMEITDLAD